MDLRRSSSNTGIIVFKGRLKRADQYIGSPEYKEYHAYVAVHDEEGRVDAGEIIGFDESVLPPKEPGHSSDAHYGRGSQCEGPHQEQQARQHPQVKRAGDPQRAWNAELARDAIQSRLDVEGVI